MTRPYLLLLGIVLLLTLKTGCTQLASGGPAKETTAIRGDVAVPFVFRTVSAPQPVKDDAGVPVSDPTTAAEPVAKSVQPDASTTGQADTSQLPSLDAIADVYPKAETPAATSDELAASAPPLPVTDDKTIFPDSAEPAASSVRQKPRSGNVSTGRWETQRRGLLGLRSTRVWVSNAPQTNSSSTYRKDGDRSSSRSTRSSCTNGGVCGR